MKKIILGALAASTMLAGTASASVAVIDATKHNLHDVYGAFVGHHGNNINGINDTDGVFNITGGDFVDSSGAAAFADFLRAVDDTGNNVQAHQLGEITGDIESGFDHADDTDAVVEA